MFFCFECLIIRGALYLKLLCFLFCFVFHFKKLKANREHVKANTNERSKLSELVSECERTSSEYDASDRSRENMYLCVFVCAYEFFFSIRVFFLILFKKNVIMGIEKLLLKI